MTIRTLLTLGLLATISLSCTEQQRARTWGGDSTLRLKPGERLVNVAWKQDDLWLLTRAFKPGEEPETYTFKESASWGVIEGSVTIVETKGGPR